MRRLVGGIVCTLLLGGVTASGAQEPGACSWATDTTALRDATLWGVDAVDATHVWAVGSRTNSQRHEQTLVRHWDGTAWETQPSPNVKEQSNRLNDVAVAADGTAWAVGERSRRTGKTIVQRYDGTRWRMQRSLNPSKELNTLSGVDVTPSGDVYAAGARWNAKRQYRTMIQRFDGTSWALVPGRYPGILWDLDVVAEDDVWAVGTKTERRRSRAFALHLDGTTWSEVEVPSPGNGFSVLHGVSGSAPNDVWAVGEYYDAESQSRAWIGHYDGTAWSVDEIPDLEPSMTLFDVSALDADTAVAIGQHHDYDFGEDSRVVLEWDGTSWARVEQDDERTSNWLFAVDVAPSGDAWAVGYHSTRPQSEYAARRTCY